MRNTLHFSLPEDRLHNAYNALELALTAPPAYPNPSKGDEVQLFLVNSSWGRKNYEFLQPFLDTLAYNYGAGMNLVDFTANPEYCRILINNRVSGKTENRINNIIPKNYFLSGIRFVLANAIYFKANWYYPFSASNTMNNPFYCLDGSTATVPQMQKTSNTSYTEAADEYQAVLLPYQGTKSFSMLIVLPAEGKFQAVENSLNAGMLTTIRKGMSIFRVNLTMPKFSFEWGSSLKQALKNLGMINAFDETLSDFSGIADKNYEQITIWDVLHKSFITVDEKGTEASAATVVLPIPTRSTTTTTPRNIIMTINRPFLFFIYGSNGTILFVGRVLNL